MIIFKWNDRNTWPTDGEKVKFVERIENTKPLENATYEVHSGVFVVFSNSIFNKMPLFFYGDVVKNANNISKISDREIVCWESINEK